MVAAVVAGFNSQTSTVFPELKRTKSKKNKHAFFLPPVAAMGDDEDRPKDDSSEQQSGALLSLENVNPVDLGRRSRKLFDELWGQIKKLGQFTSSTSDVEDVMREGPMCDFTIPNAEYTTVLVTGATGRVGRIIIRKLQIRGYKVKALIRKADPETLETLPRSVRIAVGDIGESSTLTTAVEGCNKIICCAAARSSFTVDLNRVDNRGILNLAKAFQDYNHRLAQMRAGRSSKSKLVIAKFSKPKEIEDWNIREGEVFTNNGGGELDVGVDIDADKNGVFQGFLESRGGYVDFFKKISLPSGYTLDRYEGLVLCVCGDGKIYTLILETSGGEYDSPRRLYCARFVTRLGYSTIRIPFSKFRAMNQSDPPLDLFLVDYLTIRFEPRRQRPAAIRADVNGNGNASSFANEIMSFRLAIDYIKALPTGEETDFILVSCSGSGIDSEDREKILRAKQAGETALKNSGLGYTIIRPGPLLEEPGGQRALIFDQGNRITQGISCADVADVCVKSLHDPMARNKSFDVCYEYTSELGQGLYELVAHIPDKFNNYLTPALAVLEKNT